MELLTTYFTQCIEAAALPSDLKLRYRLSFCQSDGVAFYGSLNADDLRRLAKHLYGPSPRHTAYQRVRKMRQRGLMETLLFNVEAFSEDTVEIEKVGSDMYDHHNTMKLNWFHDHERMMENIEVASAEPELVRPYADQLEELWDDFMGRIQDHIEGLSKQLESDGHDLILAGVSEEQEVSSFETPRFRITFTELPDDDFDLDHWDEELRMDTMRAFIAGTQRYMGLKAEIIERESEAVIGEASLWGVTLATQSEHLGHDGFRRELVSEAIAQAREALASAHAQVA